MPSPPDVTVVAVGFSVGLLTELDVLLPAGSVLVLDEPDMIEARDVLCRAAAHPCVAAVMGAPTQDEPRAERLLELVARPRGVRAVIPAVEYGVVGAAVLAAGWRLPGAGPAAARILRDKVAMRRTAGAAGIAQPRWQLATGAGDVDAFRDRHGRRCVLKPANRQASLGVRLLDDTDDARAAWDHCTQADEPRMRAAYALRPRYLVEERLEGPEVSVESLVHAGSIGFANVTAKSVLRGASPVELGHVVPAAVPAAVGAALRAGVHELVRATGFQDGVLHSEWILVEGRPHFVECAARVPGDCIDRLIDLAYGGRFSEDYLAVLTGRGPISDRPSRRAAAIRFLTAEPGTVRAIAGTERAAAMRGVEEVSVSVATGAAVSAVTSSWERLGHVIATGADEREAAARADASASLIEFDVVAEAA